jgi:hypothetical protein
MSGQKGFSVDDKKAIFTHAQKRVIYVITIFNNFYVYLLQIVDGWILFIYFLKIHLHLSFLNE